MCCEPGEERPRIRRIGRLDEAERYGTYVREELALSPGALEELSVSYYQRALPAGVATPIRVRVFAGRMNWDVEVRLLGRKTLNAVLGRRDTRAIVWVTDDAERIPVLVKSEFKFGSFTATLTRRDVGGFQASPGETGRPGR